MGRIWGAEDWGYGKHGGGRGGWGGGWLGCGTAGRGGGPGAGTAGQGCGVKKLADGWTDGAVAGLGIGVNTLEAGHWIIRSGLVLAYDVACVWVSHGDPS